MQLLFLANERLREEQKSEPPWRRCGSSGLGGGETLFFFGNTYVFLVRFIFGILLLVGLLVGFAFWLVGWLVFVFPKKPPGSLIPPDLYLDDTWYSGTKTFFLHGFAYFCCLDLFFLKLKRRFLPILGCLVFP